MGPLLTAGKSTESNNFLLSSKLSKWKYLNVLQYKYNLKTKFTVFRQRQIIYHFVLYQLSCIVN